MLPQGEIAYRQIKDMIFHMRFLPGNHISALQLSKELKVSRTPIHEAIRQLVAEGLVVSSPNKGASVRFFSEDEIQEIGTIRLQQDILSSQLASYYGSMSDFERLYDLASTSQGDVYGRIFKDIEFHMGIAELSGNSLLVKQQHIVYQQIALIQIYKYTDIQDSLRQIYHHRLIVDAIKAGDLNMIRSLCCQHLGDFYSISPYVLKCCKGE